MAEEYTRAFGEEVGELETLFADSLVILKADVVNEVLFYCKELGVLRA